MMCSRVFIFLLGAVHIYNKVFAGDTFTGTLTIESNITLDTQTILSFLNISNSSVTILQNFLIADCLIIGPNTNCNCSTGFTWSNDVCYNFSCCTETPCSANVSYLPQLCVFKVNVQINGSVSLSSSIWDSNKSSQLQSALAGLNAFQYMNITKIRESNKTADFNAAVWVRLRTSKLQDILSTLEKNLIATISVNTSGMVTIVSPNTSVCYESSPILKCTFNEATDSSGWTMMSENQSFALNTGTVVQLNNSCTSQSDPSCIQLTLYKVTGIWAGIYQCQFTTGKIKHTATTTLSVALLPDVVTMVSNPVIGDCSNLTTDSVNISVTATIPQSTEKYNVTWSCSCGSNKYETDKQIYSFTTSFSCSKSTDTYVKITFVNTKGQTQTTSLNIPVIYAGITSCSEEVDWPKTPAGVTVTNQTCEPGRVGFKSRQCIGPNWESVISFCVNQQLIIVSNQAENFQKGLDATPEMAMNIFEGLLNNSVLLLPSGSSINNFADVSASIKILNVMASASTINGLQEEVLPNFINAASNMLKTSWGSENNSVLHNMSSTYLRSVEDLVKNIRVSNSSGVNSTNLELKFCASSNCNVSVFDIGVSMNKTNGTLKTIAIKNLSVKLQNTSSIVVNSLVMSATLENNNDSSLEIKMDFPNEQLYNTTPSCVFWNTTEGNWSNTGCTVNASDANHTICICNHLTPFCVLMSKGDIPVNSTTLDIITNVGLGVSICSLLIFLIIEALVWSAVVKTNLSHFRHTAMVNIAMFLLLANCSFLASTSPKYLHEPWCLVLAICKHLFYLAMFCWMLCMSFMLVHQLTFVFSPLRKRVFIFFSSFVGYVCPVLIVGSSYVYCKYTKMEYHEKETCWLVYKGLFEGSMHAFLIPVGTVILTNIFCMMVVILTLVKSAFPDGSIADDKETAKSILKVVVFLTPVFGITWVIGFVQLILDDSNFMRLAARYSFTILNSFQGLFILLTGFLSEQRVRNELYRVIRGKPKGKSDSMKNLISNRPTEEK